MIVQAPFADSAAIASVTLATSKAKALLSESKLSLSLSYSLFGYGRVASNLFKSRTAACCMLFKRSSHSLSRS